MHEKSFNEIAANWWAEQMRLTLRCNPKYFTNKEYRLYNDRIKDFRDNLSICIKNVVSINAIMNISTYQHNFSNLLLSLAMEANIPKIIFPENIEMVIRADVIYIYDCSEMMQLT